MRRSVTVSLPESLTERLDSVSREEGTTRSDVVREALRRYFAVRQFRAIREELIREAEAKGIITDQDVFDVVS
jgi:metal-responsive CopG/Arc/MetJ family transcriptional regulator